MRRCSWLWWVIGEICGWIRRQNAIRLEEKEKQEKEMLKEIIEEAEEYKIEFYWKRKVTIENNKAANRENEKVSGQNAILQT